MGPCELKKKDSRYITLAPSVLDEENYDVLPLSDNPALAQIRKWKERKARNSKAKAYLFSKLALGIWHFLKDECQGKKKIKSMQVFNLVTGFEIQKMKKSNNQDSRISSHNPSLENTKDVGCFPSSDKRSRRKNNYEMKSDKIDNNNKNWDCIYPSCPYYKKRNHP
ncbi:hypothetical protein HKD37_13G036471 [Glycine soja]